MLEWTFCKEFLEKFIGGVINSKISFIFIELIIPQNPQKLSREPYEYNFPPQEYADIFSPKESLKLGN